MKPAEMPMPPDGEDALERARWYVSVDPDGIDVFGSKSMIEILARYDDQARQLQEATERVAALEAAGQEVLAADGACAREERGSPRRWDEALATLDSILALSVEWQQ